MRQASGRVQAAPSSQASQVPASVQYSPTPQPVPEGSWPMSMHCGRPMESHCTWPRWQVLVTKHEAPLRHIVGVSLGTQLNCISTEPSVGGESKAAPGSR